MGCSRGDAKVHEIIDHLRRCEADSHTSRLDLDALNRSRARRAERLGQAQCAIGRRARINAGAEEIDLQLGDRRHSPDPNPSRSAQLVAHTVSDCRPRT